jgi:hypothetical protein
LISEIARHRKTNTALRHLHERSKTASRVEVDSRKVVAREWAEGEMEEFGS